MLEIDLDITEEKNNYITLPTNKIKSKKQGRVNFDKEVIKEIADDFLNPEIGQIQPIVVSKADEDGVYWVIAGETRLRAAILAGTDIECKIKDINPLITFFENIHRKDIDIFEIGGQLKIVQETFQVNNNELAKLAKRDGSYVSRHLKVFSAGEEFKELCKKGKVTSISMADDLEKIYQIKPNTAKKLVEKGITRESLQKYLKKIKNGVDTRVRKTKKEIIPTLGMKDENGETEAVTLVSKDSIQNQKGNVIKVDLFKVFVTGVK
jgi:ParB family chromosome partitioning protein